MRNALSITFNDTRHTEHLEQFIENRFYRLKKMHNDIVQCHVTVKTPHRSRHSGTPKQVAIVVWMPGKSISAKRMTDPGDGIDLYAAISDAFHALEIQAESRIPGRINYKNFRKLSHLNPLHTAS